jgi:hypothetical protein
VLSCVDFKRSKTGKNHAGFSFQKSLSRASFLPQAFLCEFVKLVDSSSPSSSTMKLRSGKVINEKPRERLLVHDWKEGDVLKGGDGWGKCSPRFYRVVKKTPHTTMVQELQRKCVKTTPARLDLCANTTWWIATDQLAVYAATGAQKPTKHVKRTPGGTLVVTETLFGISGLSHPKHFHLMKWDCEPVKFDHSLYSF